MPSQAPARGRPYGQVACKGFLSGGTFDSALACSSDGSRRERRFGRGTSTRRWTRAPTRRSADGLSNRPTRSSSIGVQVAGLGRRSSPVAVWHAPQANWDLALFAILLAFSVFSDLTAISTDLEGEVSGSFLALVLAMVFLGGTPAALIGVMTILDRLAALARRLALPPQQPRSPTRSSRWSAGSPSTRSSTGAGIADTTPPSTCSSSPLFLLALAINFTMIASYALLPGTHAPSASKVRTALIPLLPSELAAALMAVGGRLPLRPGRARRESRSSASSSSPSSTCSAPCSSPSSGPRSWSCAASSWPASRSGC